jgi:hypothetical protein
MTHTLGSVNGKKAGRISEFCRLMPYEIEVLHVHHLYSNKSWNP